MALQETGWKTVHHYFQPWSLRPTLNLLTFPAGHTSQQITPLFYQDGWEQFRAWAQWVFNPNSETHIVTGDLRTGYDGMLTRILPESN